MCYRLLEPIKLLLIEDNPGDARLIQVLLSSVRGHLFIVTTALSLAEGFQCLDTGPFDVVLLDLNLPDSMGYTTFEQLLHHCKTANLSQVPIILLTGLEDEELALDTVRRGAQDYLVKIELDGDLLSRSIRYAIERKRVEEALRESEERYSLAMRGANDGLWDWELRSNKIYFSPRWKSILGHGEDEIGNNPTEWFHRIHQDDVERVRVAIGTHLKGASPHFESEYRIRNKDGNYLWVLTRGLAVYDADGHAYRMAGSQSDITARKQAEEQLLKNAFYDNLTGLPNRALFIDRLSQSIKHTKRRADYLFSVLFLDLDRFKVINDSLGHMVGDQLLIAVAQVLKKCLRSGDTVARLGGDEFIILLDDNNVNEDAITVSNRICQKLGESFNLSQHQVVISTSIGIVYSTLGYENPEDILRDADIAMYRAKMNGGATYSVFNIAMREQAIDRLELENDLRKALENHEFVLYYQPIQSLDDGGAARSCLLNLYLWQKKLV
jgi:diguanylate cyclase (GGDEF)-like protein/PAS domain S-box-containing protein